MKETFRWFGPSDEVSLIDIRQSGATEVVSALHHIPNGEVWTIEDINRQKAEIEKADLLWTVVESIPIHESIKLRKDDCQQRIENYKVSLANVAKCGIKVVCYNFMPVLDWTRTQLFWPLDNGGTALRFDKVEMAIFEKYLLKRPGCEDDYSQEVMRKASEIFESASPGFIQSLEDNILKGLPGTVDDLDMETFRQMLAAYDGMDHTGLKENLKYFLQQVVPVAEANGITMAIHPDDPPIDIMGLPRIIKNEADLQDLVDFVDSPSNGITFCTGSLGANPENDLPAMIRKFADRIFFVHLRNVKREANGSFYEAAHLEGSSDMSDIVKELLKIERRKGIQLPMRPDHGHQIMDDLSKASAYPGYTAIGRLKGLAEIRGLAYGLLKHI